MTTSDQGTVRVLDRLRGMLAALTGNDALATLGAGVPLFGPGVGLDSLTGTLLLTQVRQEYGVDVAAEDLNLDSLASLGTLATFITTARQ